MPIEFIWQGNWRRRLDPGQNRPALASPTAAIDGDGTISLGLVLGETATRNFKLVAETILGADRTALVLN